ncbi:unnamed protein product [Anisakis simplex]|uniref:Tudor domain-containing protein n=1 Tax=Anisakis simplex TaxID=6269 RepID=A0A0M3JNB8_ANISI|nr:unnamed protein product [Anisakis simplex]
MAPLKEGVYARARILQKVNVITDKNSKEANEYARVLFIDEGKMAWVSVKCLAKMDEILSYHPWQALAVAIFRVRISVCL